MSEPKMGPPGQHQRNTYESSARPDTLEVCWKVIEVTSRS